MEELLSDLEKNGDAESARAPSDGDTTTTYRLGQEISYRRYVNQYSESDYAKSPYQRARERDRIKYMSTKFALVDDAQWQVSGRSWQGEMGNRIAVAGREGQSGRVRDCAGHRHFDSMEHRAIEQQYPDTVDASALGEARAGILQTGTRAFSSSK
jgi:hypothetical protein